MAAGIASAPHAVLGLQAVGPPRQQATPLQLARTSAATPLAGRRGTARDAAASFFTGAGTIDRIEHGVNLPMGRCP